VTAKYLVTGGAGFIGSHVVTRLVELDESVRVIDNHLTGRPSNLEHVAEHVEIIEGDIRDPEALRRSMEGVDVVFHLAALPSVPRSIADPVPTHDINVMGTLQVLVAARDASVRRVINSSSSSIYGDSEVLPKHEGLPPHPKSPYAASKRAAEEMCRIFWEVYGLETVSLRYFNVFGPRQDPTSQYSAVLPKFITAYLRGEAPTIYGDGEQTRGFTYVGNVVRANLLAAAANASGVVGEVFNIAGDERHSINEIAGIVHDLVGASEGVRPRYVEERAGDVRHSWADVSKAQRRLGYRVETNTRDGLAETVEWFRTRMA